MGSYASEPEFDFTPAPAGTHPAVCNLYIEIGTIVEQFQGKAKLLKKARIGWELLGTKVVKKNGEVTDQAITIWQDYTLSLAQNSHLRKMLLSWRSVEFTQEQLKKFDVSKVLGAPCLLSVIHSKPNAQNRIYANVETALKLPQGYPLPSAIMPRTKLDFEEWDQAIFAGLHEKLRAKIESSVEYKAKFMGQGQQNSAYGPMPAGGADSVTKIYDDLPF